MALVVVITRDVEGRYRGFLGSVMLELAPGVYAQPRMNPSVRGRVWSVLTDWFGELGRGSVIMTWVDSKASGGLGLLTLGEPPKEIIEHDAMLLVRRRAPDTHSTT